MTRTGINALVANRLQSLVGLPLSIARDAADMKVFHFGPISPSPSGRGTVGTYALHIQCPWRIVTDDAVFTGTTDQFSEPTENGENGEIDETDRQSKTLQAVRLAALLKGYDVATRSYVNATDHLVVLSVTTDAYCGVDLELSGGYCLQILPTGSLDEDWRLLEIGGAHLVIEGGRAELVS